MKKPLVIAVALLLAGCGTTAKQTQDTAIGQQALQKCLAATDVPSMRSTCFQWDLGKAGEGAFAEAEDHWNKSVATLPPDQRLLAAALWPNIAMAKEAIASGANVNREFTSREVIGARSTGERRRTVLDIAVRDFEPKIAEFLMLEGADPNWRENEDDLDMFTGRITMSQSYTDKDGNSRNITGLEMAELGLKYGLTPTAPSLFYLEGLIQGYKPGRISSTNVKPFYDKLIQRMTPEVDRQLAALKEKQRLAAQQREIEEQKRFEERMKSEERLRIASERATQALNARKRVVGTRICKEQPSQFGTLIYVGYVEGLGPEKVQIRVSNAVYKGAPSLSPGGFRESILWDYPNSWNICE